MEFEAILLTIEQCFIYRIPPLIRSEGHRASNWNVDNFLWQGRLKIVTHNDKLTIKLEDVETGNLFAECPYDDNGHAVEAVLDSSRYFVIRVEDHGRHAYLGLGFADRSEAFDFNITLQDHLRHKKVEKQIQEENVLPEVDYSLKEGQTISLNLSGKMGKNKNLISNDVPENSTSIEGSSFRLPPPPSSSSSSSLKPSTQLEHDNSLNEFGQFQEANETDLNTFNSNTTMEGWAKFD